MPETPLPRQIISPKWLIPVVPAGLILTDHSLVIEGHRILAILPRDQAAAQYAGVEELTLASHALLPGFINVHGHAAMTLLRGYADDRALMDWLNNHIWPIENALISHEYVYDGTSLAIAEMMRSGTTCAVDSYFFPNASADAYSEHGLRAQVSMPIIQFPTNWAKDEADHLHKALETHNDIKHRPLLTTALAPHAPYTVTDAGFEKIVMYAGELDIPIHLHLHETATEVAEAVMANGQRPIARMAELGVISPALQAVHMTQLTDDEIELIATNNVQVAHCPDSNLKLASGYCRVPDLIKAGVNVAIGTDGVASNNNLDMSAELRSAALLAKGLSGDPTALPAELALAMGTIGGARFIGMEDQLGSLEAGKLADIIAVDLSDPLSQPVHNPISQVVYSTSGEQVSHVWINGEVQLKDKQFVKLDLQRILGRANEWRDRIAQTEV